ncbi:hypothetical protein HBA54_07150 [Pelagibius litoralis]|uniref:Uncharacterized protein n=1 Tax=Pelagibius litoralis TaxID=374515 RepID=A0A967C471_9PROT|nr:hypothetical protein [Pelagibius litoralis]NIA68365.1 hypothetical protein [Pelagibius litoralis]
MDLAAFRDSLKDSEPPVELAPALAALWQAAKDDWDAAHGLAQSDSSAEGAWVHAYLHRVEGDESNAGYWYRRAGKPHAKTSLDQEWEEIVTALL